MKALRYHKFGGPEVLQFDDVPIPQVGAGEVLIRVSGCGVNPIDYKMREGFMAESQTLPMTSSNEFSGTVEAVGLETLGFSVGDEVYGGSWRGTCAEYAVAAVKAISLKPSSMSLVEASAVPIGAQTAWQATFETANVEAGQRVLIHAAAGGVGHFAVQLAKWKGAYVIGTASEKNHAFVKGLGADEVVDYHITPFETVVHDIDMVLETIGGDNFAKSFQTMKSGGILVSLVGPAEAPVGKRSAFMSMDSSTARLTEIARFIDEAKLRAVIEKVFPFQDAVLALNEVQKGRTVGKIVIDVLK